MADRPRPYKVRLVGCAAEDLGALAAGLERAAARGAAHALDEAVNAGVLSLSDYASVLLFIWRFVWGVV